MSLREYCSYNSEPPIRQRLIASYVPHFRREGNTKNRNHTLSLSEVAAAVAAHDVCASQKKAEVVVVVVDCHWLLREAFFSFGESVLDM